MISIKYNRRTFSKLGFKCIWIFFLSSCLTPVDFTTENIGGTLVVTGQISSLQDKSIIQLGLTAQTEQLPDPLSGATIKLFVNDNEMYNYTEDTSAPGNYLLQGTDGVAGNTYYIRITTPAGKVYESATEKMPGSPGMLTTSYEIVKEDFTDLEGIVTPDNFLKLYASASLPETPEVSYLKWSVEEAFLLSPTDFPDPFGSVPPPCYIVQNADPQRISLFNREDLNITSPENLLIGSRVIDWTFLEKHAFTTYQSSLTKEAFEYWRKINILANQVGSIFDTPPAEITGNIRNVSDPGEKVLGYFQASNEVIDRFFIYPYNLPFPLLMTNCDYNISRFEYPTRCLDCTTVRNSSFARPDWF
ncbi:MAG: hypothetical protein C0490_03350, partial [Marivirga sp.]|nr:hypothetical protein [Marivirga sp.]